MSEREQTAARLAQAAHDGLLELGQALRSATPAERGIAGLALVTMGWCIAANAAEELAQAEHRRKKGRRSRER